MNYQESLDWIHSKLKFGIKPGLKRMDWMLEQLGNPQKRVKGVHIVGTNGKGSTVANMQHIFRAADYKVGTFTSPYIMDFRERISINGQMISKVALVDLVSRVYDVVEMLPTATGLEPATEFEIITVMMFLYFADVNPVDILLVEAGLGGRQDSTNVFHPLLVICPSIGLDHQAILGDTYEEIAREKAGVIKEGVPFVFAADKPEVKAIFLERCHALSAPIYELGKDFELEEGLYQEWSGLKIDHIKPGLLGHHQVQNAALAIKASCLLQPNYPKVTTDKMRQGLAQTRWIGRTELIAPNLMLDGAHNKESVAVLVDLLKSDYSHKNIQILFAAISDKPIDHMLEKLTEVGEVTVTDFDYPRAVTLDAYPSQYKKVSHFSHWLDKINTKERDYFYVVTGSLYFISEVRQALLKSRKK